MARHEEIDRLIVRVFDEHEAAVRELLKIGEPALHRLLQIPLYGGSEAIPFEELDPHWKERDFRDWLASLDGALSALAKEHLDAFLAAIREADRVRNWIVIAILADMKLETPEVVDIFLEAMKGRESLLREYAVQGLWRSRSPRAVGPLIKALSDRAGDVRYKAVQAICGLGDERALEPLKKMLAAKSNADRKWIHETAAKAIVTIESRQRARQSRGKSRRNEPPET